MPLSADEVRTIQFATAPLGRRGYAKNEVDEFLYRIAKTLAGEDDLTAAEIHHVTFRKSLLGKRGYDERLVDEFLDRVEDDLASRGGEPAGQVPVARDASQAGLPIPGG